jgi:short-subunit dehydrogenase
LKVAITGSVRGLGLAITALLRENNIEVVEINRDILDLSTLSVDSIDLTKIDVLINNAAIEQIGLYKDYTYKSIVDMINVNLLAPMLLTNKYVKENSKGLIINITSSCITRPYGTHNTTYYTSKNGLSAFTNSIREELKSENFRVVEIIPGRLDTDMSVDKHNAIATIEVAKAVLFCINNPVIQQLVIKHPNR